MSKESKNIRLAGWIALAVILVLALIYAKEFFLFSASGPANYASGIGQFKVVDQNAIVQIEALRVCGSWPIIGVSPSASRGNPFARLTGNSSPMASLSTAECMPVSP